MKIKRIKTINDLPIEYVGAGIIFNDSFNKMSDNEIIESNNNNHYQLKIYGLTYLCDTWFECVFLPLQ